MAPRAAAALLFLAALGGCASPPPRERGRIDWRPFEPESCRRARAEDRLILVCVGADWCHWCHVMDAETWTDPDVAALVRDHFVAVRADADAQPDVAERYAAWGWPATAVLTPDARPVLERRGYQEPRHMADLLRGLIEDRRAGRPIARVDEPPPVPHEGPLEEVRLRVQRSLDSYYDPERGGWGRGIQKYPLSAPVEHAFLRTRLGAEGGWGRRALETLRAEANLIDPVWGGMYQYSEGGGWTDPHFEKIATVQAGALENFVEAYRATGDPEWLRLAREIERYLLGFLRDPAGGFRASQDADLGRHGEPGAVDGARYFALDDAGRRALGMPRIDPAVYADYNGLIAAALCRLHEATGDPAPLREAGAALDRIVREHSAEGGGLRHAAGDAGPVLHLADQVEVGRAALLLMYATPDAAHGHGLHEKWRGLAKQLARVIVERFEDREGGGFYAHTEDPSATGVFAERRKPFETNARAARFLIGLSRLAVDQGHHRGRNLEEKQWRAAALRALQAFASPDVLDAQDRFTGDYLLAIEESAAPQIEFRVMGSPGPGLDALWAAALRVYEPLKVLRFQPPSSEPEAEADPPVVYVGDGRYPLVLIYDATELDAFSRRLR